MFGDFEYVTDYRDDAKLRGQFDELQVGAQHLPLRWLQRRCESIVAGVLRHGVAEGLDGR